MSRRTHVIRRQTAPSRTSPTFTGVGFVASIPERGVFDPQRPCLSLASVRNRHGSKQNFSQFDEWCELFYAEGGRTLYVLPVRGPAAAPATLNIPGTSGTTLTARVIDPDTGQDDHGEWGNGAAGGYAVEVANGPSGASHRVLIAEFAGEEVGRTAEFSSRDLMNGVIVDKVRFAIGGGSGLPPVAAAANLAGGTLDRTNITQAQIDAAIDLPAKDLGPGQIAAPDWPTDTTHDKLMAQRAAKNRTGFPDTTDTTSKSTVLSLAGLSQGDVDGYGAAGLAHPWVIIQGTADSTGRYVPASAFYMAKCNQVDLAAGPGQAPAGVYGRQTSSLVTGLRATYSDDDQAELEAAGVNLLITRNSEVRADGNRTLADPDGLDKLWLQLGVSRLDMAVNAVLDSTGQQFEHLQVTPINIAKLDTALKGEMAGLQGQFFPGDDDPGWVVDTSDAVNTGETIAAGQLNAAVGHRPAKGADMVFIYLTMVDIGQPVG